MNEHSKKTTLIEIYKNKEPDHRNMDLVESHIKKLNLQFVVYRGCADTNLTSRAQSFSLFLIFVFFVEQQCLLHTLFLFQFSESHFVMVKWISPFKQESSKLDLSLDVDRFFTFVNLVYVFLYFISGLYEHFELLEPPSEIIHTNKNRFIFSPWKVQPNVTLGAPLRVQLCTFQIRKVQSCTLKGAPRVTLVWKVQSWTYFS